MKNFYIICEEKARQGIEDLKKYIDSTKDLLYTEEKNDNITSIEVELFDNYCETLDFVGRWEFNDNEELINY